MQETDGSEKCTVKQGGPNSEKTKTVCFPSSVDLALYSVCVYMQASINVRSRNLGRRPRVMSKDGVGPRFPWDMKEENNV